MFRDSKSFCGVCSIVVRNEIQKYRCYIDRLYFGQHASCPCDNARYQVVLFAKSRTDAAAKYWTRYQAVIIPQLLERIRRVSVNVSGGGAIGPRSKNRNLASRMSPIGVYTR